TAAGKSLAQLGKDARFRDAAESAPLRSVFTRGGRPDDGAADEAFARAFAQHGIDVRACTPEGVERWLRECPPRMVEPVLVALNDWERYAVSGKERKRLREVLRRVDPDRWRGRLREALIRGDTAPVRKLAAEVQDERLPPAALSRLGEALFRQKD